MILLFIGKIAFFVLYILQTVFLAMYLSSMYYPAMGHLVWVQAFGVLTWSSLELYSWRYGTRLIKRMWIVWLLYTVGFVASVVAIFLQDVGKHGESTFFGPNVLRSTLYLAPVLFTLLINTTVSAENLKLIEVLCFIGTTLDLFDGIEMFNVLTYRCKELDISKEMMWAILCFASLCFLVSAMVLYEHKFKFSEDSGKEKNCPCMTFLRAVIQIFFVNLPPFLILRGIFLKKFGFSEAICVTKNVLSTLSCIADINFVCKKDDTTITKGANAFVLGTENTTNVNELPKIHQSPT